MAVYTHLTHDQITDFLSAYDIGELSAFEGIIQGIDNTNYKIETTQALYILTIFESRIDPKDLPSFCPLWNICQKTKSTALPRSSKKITQLFPRFQTSPPPSSLFSMAEVSNHPTSQYLCVRSLVFCWQKCT